MQLLRKDGIICNKGLKVKGVGYKVLPYACGLLLLILYSCSASRHGASPNRKYSPAELQKDYTVFRSLLEEKHPGLYWYTSKDSIDYYFDWGQQQLKDSLNEPDFRKVLSYIISKIGCGHTSVSSSKRYSRFLDTTRLLRIFPLSLKIWDDTAVVSATLSRRDSILKRGTIINKINGVVIRSITDSLFRYLPTDGYNTTHKYQTLSNRGTFGSLYSSVYGYAPLYTIDFTDSTGKLYRTNIRTYNPPIADSATRAAIARLPRPPQPSKRERKQLRKNSARLLKMDTANHVAMMNLNSFAKGYQLRPFFRRSFKALRKHDLNYLIIDVRSNGGGSVSNSTSLTKYISDHRFKIGDSLYAVNKRSKYKKYIEDDFWNRFFMTLFTQKRKDGNYHFGYFERHYFKPKKKNHYNGKVYVLTGGNSFSATTLFAGAVREQDNVTIVGEETGGGAYGNNAWLIPDVTLPVTKVRFRLPLFRLVIDKNIPKNGKGVQPEVISLPTVQAIRAGVDYKLDKTMELIQKEKEVSH